MANLGYDLESGRVEKWLQQVGDRVARGQPIVVANSPRLIVGFEFF